MSISSSRHPLAWCAGGLLALVLPLCVVAKGEPWAAPNNLVLEGRLPGATTLAVQTLGLEGKPLVITLSDGRLGAGIHIAEGKDRRLALIATGADGKVLYEGEVQLDVNAEFVPQVAVEFKSRDGEDAGLTLASHRVQLEFAGVEREGELYMRVSGAVFDADGRRLELEIGELDWDIHDPWVREHLAPCPKSPGGLSLCAEFLPPKPAVRYPVDACFRGRICTMQYTPPVIPVWREVAVSFGHHACALRLDGQLYCWGNGENGQLGYVAPNECSEGGSAGTTVPCSGYPQLVQCANVPCNFTQVSAGLRHTCALDANQDAWCWGDNYDGQLGLNYFDTTHEGSPEPRRVSGGFKFLSIRAASTSTCGLTTAHQVFCWGNNLGLIPTETARWANDPRLVVTPEPIVDLDVSHTHACGRAANGNVYCWGTNQEFELGSLSWPTAPTCRNCPAVPLLMQANIPALANEQVSLLSTGAHGTCTHTTSGKTPCWGRLVPAFPANRSLDRLSRGFQHYCAISRGAMQCAGMHALGDGSDYFESPGVGPVSVDPKTFSFRELDTGMASTCAIGYDENVYCWGSTLHAQLGLGQPAGPVTQPTALGFPTTLKFPPKVTRSP